MVAQTRQVFTHHRRIGLAVAPRHVRDDAFKRVLLAHLFALRDSGVASGATGLRDVAELDVLVARAKQEDLAHVARQVFKWRFDVELVVLGQAFQHAEIKAVAPVPALDGAAGQAQGRERHDARRVKELHRANAVAGGASAHGRVEREQARLQFADGVVANRAGELGVEQMLFGAVHFHHQSAAFGQAQRGFKALGQALAQCVACRGIGFGAHLQAVHHHVNVVLLGFLECGQVFDFHRFAVDAKAHIAQRLHLLKHLRKFTFALARDRRHDHQARLFGQGQHRVHHLAHGLRLQGQVVVGAVRRAGAGKQEAQIVVNFGHRADGGARVVAGGFLLDADGG